MTHVAQYFGISAHHACLPQNPWGGETIGQVQACNMDISGNPATSTVSFKLAPINTVDGHNIRFPSGGHRVTMSYFDAAALSGAAKRAPRVGNGVTVCFTQKGSTSPNAFVMSYADIKPIAQRIEEITSQKMRYGDHRKMRRRMRMSPAARASAQAVNG